MQGSLVSPVPAHSSALPQEGAEPALQRATQETRVALVNMPFAMADRPSIQCGLLKSALIRAGHSVDVHYLNLEFSAQFGASFYRELAIMRADLLLGDWLFSVAAFDERNDEADYLAACPTLPQACKSLGIDFERLCEMRRQILPDWIRHWGETVDWGTYSAVGFTCTFEQNSAAFALAKIIKEKYPETVLIFGGSNFDGDMGKEYVRSLPFIDYAVVGEGDIILPQMISRIIQGESALGLPGVAGMSDGELIALAPGPLVQNLDQLPDPDYDDYFSTLFRLGREQVLNSGAPLLLFESSRGCWWGEKQHCTFCGLNNNGMRFRAKSPGAAAEQLRRLAAKYKIINFEAVDNIMDYKYLEQLCKPLADDRYDYKIFYEVKANLTPSQLKTMARAGISSIQPGIESLSSHVLNLMRKGTTMLRNIRLLKWAQYYKMRVGWNVITGFPGETEEDYRNQILAAKHLRHLQPPTGFGRIWLERFSPYFFDAAFPVKNVEPLTAYRFIYPENTIDLKEIAYFFSYEMDDTLPDESYHDLFSLLNDWKEAWQRKPRPQLTFQRCPDWVQVLDQRGASPQAYAFDGWQADIFTFCGETDHSIDSIQRHLGQSGSADIPGPDDLEAALDMFCDRGLMLREGDRFLTLALPTNAHW